MRNGQSTYDKKIYDEAKKYEATTLQTRQNRHKDKIYSNEDAKQLVKSIQNQIKEPQLNYRDEIKKKGS